MTMVSDDKDLVRTYVMNGSDPAFRALVARHVDLVYAAALRQVGDRGIAEEITQNVFVALARKAPRLAARETLAGWLYRTTLLEAKTRIRAELRRARREEKAVELAAMEHEGVSPLAEMAPLLDEGLLNLREQDREALVLRFLEDRSLREVGKALGVDEDAARKRVSRALDRLAGFFREHGFAAPAASCAALMTGAAKAAPAEAALGAIKAGLAASGSGGGFNLLIFQLMALTKTQTAAICLVFAALPLTWQHHAEARITAERAEIETQLTANRQRAEEIEAQAERNREALFQVRGETLNVESRLAAVESQIQGRAPRPTYQWDENALLVRMPKSILDQLPLNAVTNHHGHLSEQIREVLQLTEAEAQAAQGALERFVAQINSAQAGTLRPAQVAAKEMKGRKPEDVRGFDISALGDQLDGPRQALFHDLEETLGPQRFNYFRKALRDWMPLDNIDTGMNSGMAVFNFDHRVIFYKPEPGQEWLDWQIRKPNGEMMNYTVAAGDVPAALRPHVEDWIAIAQSPPLPKESTTK